MEREDRYIVIKRKHLHPMTEASLRNEMRDLGIQTVGCVVVESDWPEYETVWKMIEERATQQQQRVEAEPVAAMSPMQCPECGMGRPGHTGACPRRPISTLGPRDFAHPATKPVSDEVTAADVRRQNVYDHISHGDEPLDAMTEALVTGIEAWKLNDEGAIDKAMRTALERIGQSVVRFMSGERRHD